MTIIKTKKNYVFGGYTSKSFSQTPVFGHSVADSTVFLFRLRSNNETLFTQYFFRNTTGAFYNPLHYKYAVYMTTYGFPCFGYNSYYSGINQSTNQDIYIPPNALETLGTTVQISYAASNYELAGERNCQISDIEVYTFKDKTFKFNNLTLRSLFSRVNLSRYKKGVIKIRFL